MRSRFPVSFFYEHVCIQWAFTIGKKRISQAPDDPIVDVRSQRTWVFVYGLKLCSAKSLAPSGFAVIIKPSGLNTRNATVGFFRFFYSSRVSEKYKTRLASLTLGQSSSIHLVARKRWICFLVHNSVPFKPLKFYLIYCERDPTFSLVIYKRS